MATKVISLAILRHVEATSDERSAYLKMRRACRRRRRGRRKTTGSRRRGGRPAPFSSVQNGMSKCPPQEQVVSHGFRQRIRPNAPHPMNTRTTGRGGKGIVRDVGERPQTASWWASFPVEDPSDQIMLVTDKGPADPLSSRGYPDCRPARPRASSCFDNPPKTSMWSRSSHIGEEAENGNGSGG